MTSSPRRPWFSLALVGFIAAMLAFLNAGERVVVDLGFVAIYRVPLVPLILLAFVAGMLAMYLLGLPHDLRVRDALRRAGIDPSGAPVQAPPPRLPAAGVADGASHTGSGSEGPQVGGGEGPLPEVTQSREPAEAGDTEGPRLRRGGDDPEQSREPAEVGDTEGDAVPPEEMGRAWPGPDDESETQSHDARPPPLPPP